MEQSPQKHPEDQVQNLSDILNREYEEAEDIVEFHEKVAAFALKLKQKYPDFESRRLWHLLIKSTPLPGRSLNIEDYPGEDSIVRFIEKLQSKT